MTAKIDDPNRVSLNYLEKHQLSKLRRMHYFPPSFLSFLLLSTLSKGTRPEVIYSHGITTELYNLLHKKPLPPLHIRHVGEEKEERRGGWGRGKRKVKEGGGGGEGKQRGG